MGISNVLDFQPVLIILNKHNTSCSVVMNFFSPVFNTPNYLFAFLCVNLVPTVRVELTKLFILSEAAFPFAHEGNCCTSKWIRTNIEHLRRMWHFHLCYEGKKSE